MTTKDQSNEHKESPEIRIGKQLVKILDGALKESCWDSSLFLRNAKNQLKALLREANTLVGEDQSSASVLGKDGRPQALQTKEGYIKVYILLYQLDSNNLRSWLSLVKSLIEYNVNRPTYREEQYIQELIRSKKEIDRYGYAIINVKEGDMYYFEKQPVDPFGHEILVLKEKAIKSENIIEFVHANKRRYVLKESELVYIGDNA
jgi:Dot/Icm secretion system protein IcmQ